MTTIKIKPCHPSQGEFVLIEKKDFDPSTHELLEGESLGTEGQGDRVPTVAELLAARADLLAEHDNLQQRERALDERAQRLAEAEERVGEQARANEAEAQRLRDEAANLQAAKDAAVAAQSQVAPATATAEKPVKAAKA